jgi:glycosyltransferase involved in cell wall biosynthesis
MAKKNDVSLCVIFHGSAAITPLLKSAYGEFDGYHFTLATTPEKKEDAAENVRQVKNFLNAMKARGAEVTFSEFDWIDDFAAARNFNCQHAKTRWVMFLDSDDALEMAPGAVRQLCKNTDEKHPQIHGLFLPYIYDRNEVLNTMRLWRHGDGGWAWADGIHERVEQQAFELPEGAFAHCDDIKVRHRFKTPEEKKAAVVRNAVIARRDYEKAEPKYRARLARTIAMELKMEGKARESIPYQEELFAHYANYPEGRQAAADIAKACLTLAQQEPEQCEEHLALGLEWAKKAGPAYECLVYHAMHAWEDCLKACQRSAGAGPQATHEGELFERGLVYACAADAAMELGMRPEVIERMINKIPAPYRTESLIHAPVKFLSAVIDRIEIIVPGTPQHFDENGGGGMLGGSEEAVMYLSRELARAGRNVRVYAPLPPHRCPGLDQYGVDWQEMDSFDVEAEHGVGVFWRSPQLVLNIMRAKAEGKAVVPGFRRTYIWLHDIHTGLQDRLQEIAFKGVDGILTLSKFHREGIESNSPGVGKYFDLANGIPAEDFEPGESDPERDPNLVLFTSSPDRGLKHLLAAWPEVKKACPQARLDVYYSWDMLAKAQPGVYEDLVKSYDAVKHLDVRHLGGVDHSTLHRALKTANVWAYSHYDNVTVETSCISLMKAKAAGCFPLITAHGALPETAAGYGKMVEDPADYAKELVLQILNPMSELERDGMRYDALERHSWKSVAEKFSAVLTQKFDPRPAPVGAP